MEIQLVTRDGKIVGNFQIPEKPRLPEVVIWQDRAFHLDEPNKIPIYSEVFSYVIPV
jgi:hypothetical protein